MAIQGYPMYTGFPQNVAVITFDIQYDKLEVIKQKLEFLAKAIKLREKEYENEKDELEKILNASLNKLG